MWMAMKVKHPLKAFAFWKSFLLHSIEKLMVKCFSFAKEKNNWTSRKSMRWKRTDKSDGKCKRVILIACRSTMRWHSYTHTQRMCRAFLIQIQAKRRENHFRSFLSYLRAKDVPQLNVRMHQKNTLHQKFSWMHAVWLSDQIVGSKVWQIFCSLSFRRWRNNAWLWLLCRKFCVQCLRWATNFHPSLWSFFFFCSIRCFLTTAANQPTVYVSKWFYIFPFLKPFRKCLRLIVMRACVCVCFCGMWNDEVQCK